MKPADDFSNLGGGLFHWEAYDPASKVDLSACALVSGGGLFFIDPIALRAEAMEELLADAGTPPAGVLLTNANHVRAAEAYRRRFSIPVLAHAGAASIWELKPDIFLVEEGIHPAAGGFQVIALPGAAAGEMALFHPADGGVIVVGDALINLPSNEFSILPDKYCANPKELRRSLARLLDFSFVKMFFAHGPPLMTGAKNRLTTLLKG
jgi:glyoxylase-like metal-dependent hydrolase (beta-lactamase superfamily II)